MWADGTSPSMLSALKCCGLVPSCTGPACLSAALLPPCLRVDAASICLSAALLLCGAAAADENAEDRVGEALEDRAEDALKGRVEDALEGLDEGPSWRPRCLASAMACRARLDTVCCLSQCNSLVKANNAWHRSLSHPHSQPTLSVTLKMIQEVLVTSTVQDTWLGSRLTLFVRP